MSFVIQTVGFSIKIFLPYLTKITCLWDISDLPVVQNNDYQYTGIHLDIYK